MQGLYVRRYLYGEFGPAPASSVLLPGNWLQMVGVDAGTVAAEMVYLHTGRYRTDKQLVHIAMGGLLTPIPLDPAVSVTGYFPLPIPATRLWVHLIASLYRDSLRAHDVDLLTLVKGRMVS